MKGFFGRVVFFLFLVSLFAGLVVFSTVNFSEIDLVEDNSVKIESDYVRAQADFTEVLAQRVLGSVEAPLGLTIYTDFACDGCREFYEEVLPWLKFAQIGEDQVRVATKFYPLLNKNPESLVVSQAALCAAEQGDFYSYHNLLFETQSEWKGNVILQDYLIQLAKKARYRESQFRKCLLSGRYEEYVKLELADAIDNGIKGAPSLVLRKDDRTRLVEGKITVELLESEINDFLASFDEETTDEDTDESATENSDESEESDSGETDSENNGA